MRPPLRDPMGTPWRAPTERKRDMEDSNANQVTSPSPTDRRPGGPRTAEGKRRSCQNARKHGLYTDERFLECAALERGSADPRFWGPRFFPGATDKPRTPAPGVRATQLRAALICLGAVLAAFKKIKNRGNELKDLLQRQGITEIAASKRTHFRAEKAAVGAQRGGISRIVEGRLAVPRLKWSGAITAESSPGVALTFRSAVQEIRDQPAHLKAVATQIRGTKRECL
jgi:hypothetical protein